MSTIPNALVSPARPFGRAVGIVCLMLYVAAAAGAQESGDDGLTRLRALRAEAEAAKVSSRKKEKVYETIIREYADHPDETAREIVAWAMLRQANSSYGEDAEDRYAVLITKFDGDENPAIRRHVATAKYRQASRIKDIPARVEVLDNLLAVYRDEDDPAMRTIVEDIAIAKLRALKDADGVIAIYDDIILRLEAEPDEDSRARRAWAMQRKAYEYEDPAEKIRLLDRVIAAYADDPSEKVASVVDRSMEDKAKFVTDEAEKIRILDDLLARCGEQGRKVSWFAKERVKLAPDPAAKDAVYDALLLKYGDRLEPADVISLMYDKAKLATTDAEENRRYGQILARFGDAEDGSTDFYRALSMSGKIRLTADKAEKLALYDALIDLSRRSEDRFVRNDFAGAILDKAALVDDGDELSRAADQVITLFKEKNTDVEWTDFAKAVEAKVKASGDESLRNTFYDTIIAGDYDEVTVCRARGAKAEKASDDQERIRLIDELIASHQTSTNDTVAWIVLRAMSQKAELLPNEQKIPVLQTIVDRCGGKMVARSSRYFIDDVIRRLTRLTGDTTVAVGHYDEVIRKADNQQDIVKAMMMKCDYVDNEKKLLIYDEILNTHSESTIPALQRYVIKAMFNKAELLADASERVALYERIMFGFPHYDKSAVYGQAKFAFTFWYNMLDTLVDRRQLVDRYLSTFRNRMEPSELVDTLLKKAELTGSSDEAVQIYDEIIDLGRKAMAETSGNQQYRYYASSKVTVDQLAKALEAKAKLVHDAAEKVKLYDEILAMADAGYSGVSPWTVQQILKEKATATGDSSTRDTFYDSRLKQAATDAERASWLDRKADATRDREEARAIRAELAATFADSADEEAQSLAASAIIKNARSTQNKAEQARLYDTVIEKFGDSASPRMTYPVSTAYLGKARLEKDLEKKLRLYDLIIEKYLDSNGFSAVDSAIAERFRWSDKDAAKP